MTVRSVVHVGPNLLPVPPPLGGAIERKMWALARAQVALGIDAKVIAVSAGDPQEPAPHPEIIVVASPNRAIFGLRSAWRIRREHADIVHLHSRPEIAVTLRLLGYRGAIVLSFNFPIQLPAVVHRVAGGGYGRGLGWILTRVIDLFLPESRYAAEEFRSRGGRIPVGRGAVFWNGTDCPPVQPRNRPERPQALFVGRFVRQKGADLYAAASERLPGWDFVAIGPRGEFHSVGGDPTAVTNLGQVDHLGPQPDAIVARHMASATCLVLPTREWEVFGMVLVEALALGTSVVASNAAGPPEILAGCSAAHFFPPGDLGGLVAAIEAAADDSDDVRRAGQRFVQRFSWPTLAGTSLALYERAEALRAGGRRSPPDDGAAPYACEVMKSPSDGTIDGPTLGAVDRLSTGYVQPSLLAWRAREAAFYHAPSAGAVIDLGAGYGHFTREIVPGSVAVDLDFDQLKAGKGAGSYSAAVCADIAALPFRTHSSVSVISNCVLEHLEDLPGALAEIRRVLAPGGTLQTTVPLTGINDAYLCRRPWYRDMRNHQLSHRTLLPLTGWRELFNLNGFDVVAQEAAVTEGEGRRWDLLDAPLFFGVRGKTGFGAYVRLLNRVPSLRRPHRSISKSLARWILNGRYCNMTPICEYFELRPLSS